MPLSNIGNIVGSVMTGLLGLLWYDIRGHRNDIANFKTDINRMLKEEFLTEKEHTKLCEIDTLRNREETRKMIEAHTEKIIHVIKQNGNKNA